MKDYTCDGLMLFRRIHDAVQERIVERSVVPAGGTKSLMFNGRLRNLTLRRRLILEYHDAEAPGAHSSEKETLAKLEELVWWPGIARDVSRWVATCHVCKACKPQKGLTSDERMELYERPFKVLFVDTTLALSPMCLANQRSSTNR